MKSSLSPTGELTTVGLFRDWQRGQGGREWPHLPSASWHQGGASLAVVIDATDRIESLAYQVTEPCPELSLYQALAQWAEGRKVWEAQGVGWETFDLLFATDPDYLAYRDHPGRSFLTPPLQLLYHCLANYLGTVRPENHSPMICRCLGVSEGEIISYIKEHSETSLKELTGDILAGGGCTRCCPDLVQLLQAHGSSTPIPTPGRVSRVLDLYQLFCHWRPTATMELDIVDLADQTLTLAPLGGTREKDLVAFGHSLAKHSSPQINRLQVLTSAVAMPS